MIDEEALRIAAFWDRTVCLDCGAVNDEVEVCAGCEGEDLRPAREVLKTWALFEGKGEGE